MGRDVAVLLGVLAVAPVVGVLVVQAVVLVAVGQLGPDPLQRGAFGIGPRDRCHHRLELGPPFVGQPVSGSSRAKPLRVDRGCRVGYVGGIHCFVLVNTLTFALLLSSLPYRTLLGMFGGPVSSRPAATTERTSPGR
jgi:hypothetical protein